MKAMVLKEPEKIERSPLVLQDWHEPQPGPGEVRLRVRCCAVCRTDLHVVEGDLPPRKLPIVLGHQIVGEVDQLAPGCRRFQIRQRVGVACLRHTCGHCTLCRREQENLCDSSLYTGYDADGGYGEYAVVPEDFACEIPDVFDNVEAAPLLCAGVIGYRALNRTSILPEEWVHAGSGRISTSFPTHRTAPSSSPQSAG